MTHGAAYSMLYHLSQKEETNRTYEVLVSNMRDTLDSLEVCRGSASSFEKKPSCLWNHFTSKRSASRVSLPHDFIARDRERMALEFRKHWDLLTKDTGDVTE